MKVRYVRPCECDTEKAKPLPEVKFDYENSDDNHVIADFYVLCSACRQRFREEIMKH